MRLEELNHLKMIRTSLNSISSLRKTAPFEIDKPFTKTLYKDESNKNSKEILGDKNFAIFNSKKENTKPSILIKSKSSSCRITEPSFSPALNIDGNKISKNETEKINLKNDAKYTKNGPYNSGVNSASENKELKNGQFVISSTPKSHKVSLKNSLNKNNANFSKFEINILENAAEGFGLEDELSLMKKPSTPTFNPITNENELQFHFIVHKEGWQKKKRNCLF